MSLDVTLYDETGILFKANITHNLGRMAQCCGVYYACWRPEEINCEKAKHILPMLTDGIEVLVEYREWYEEFDSPNGWGTYEQFLPWLKEYASMCEKYPEAHIYVSR